MSIQTITELVDRYFHDAGILVPARLQAALALLEKLRFDDASELADHLAAKGSSGLKSHETFGNDAHARFNLVRINKNHGRRSSNLQEWGQQVIDLVRNSSKSLDRESVIENLQRELADRLRAIVEAEPLIARLRGRSAVAVIADILDQAAKKNKAGDVAQYLVGAKLLLRFPPETENIARHASNKGDRKSYFDPVPRGGDFEFGDAIIEVALGLPDEKHLKQIEDAQASHKSDVWLLTRDDRVDTWKTEISQSEGIDPARITVSSVALFVGQNVAEIARFGTEQRSLSFQKLFDLYNKEWSKSPAIRIEVR